MTASLSIGGAGIALCSSIKSLPARGAAPNRNTRPPDATLNPTTRFLAAALVALFTLAGCASTAGIDMSKVESKCGQTCSSSYSECLGKFTLFPIMAQNQCTDAMRLCVQSCPAR